MSVPPWLRVFLTAFGAAFVLISSIKVYVLLRGPSDIWWTPPTMLVSLAESQDRVRTYVRGAELQDLLAAGRLRLVTESGAVSLAAADVQFRFNNWDRVRAARIPGLLINGVAAGVAGAALLFGLMLWRRRADSDAPVEGAGRPRH